MSLTGNMSLMGVVHAARDVLHVIHATQRLDYRRSLVSLRFADECGLLSRTATGNRAYATHGCHIHCIS